MGKYDLCMKEYLQNKEHFADLFNGCCFQGKQVIKAEELQESEDTLQAVAVMTDSVRMITKMKQYKRNEEQGGYDMCQAMEELMQDYWNDGRAEGKAEGTRTVVLNMLKGGFTQRKSAVWWNAMLLLWKN